MDAPDDLVVCVVCHGPWHQVTGMLVGMPQSFPMCGRCWPESMRALRTMTSWKSPKKAKHQCEFYGPMPLQVVVLA